MYLYAVYYSFTNKRINNPAKFYTVNLKRAFPLHYYFKDKLTLQDASLNTGHKNAAMIWVRRDDAAEICACVV